MVQKYPGVRYHRSGTKVTIKSAAEEAELGPGWAESPDFSQVSESPFLVPPVVADEPEETFVRRGPGRPPKVA